jgi:hypothetical protein
MPRLPDVKDDDIFRFFFGKNFSGWIFVFFLRQHGKSSNANLFFQKMLQETGSLAIKASAYLAFMYGPKYFVVIFIWAA